MNLLWGEMRECREWAGQKLTGGRRISAQEQDIPACRSVLGRAELSAPQELPPLGDVAAGNGADGKEGCGCDQHLLKSARHRCTLRGPRSRWDATLSAAVGVCLSPRVARCAPFVAELQAEGWGIADAFLVPAGWEMARASPPPVQEPHVLPLRGAAG